MPNKLCAYGDPGCPCQDGLACHYVALSGSPAMKPPPVFHLAKIVAEELTDNGQPVFSPDEGSQDDVERARWMVCLRIVERITAALDETEKETT